MGNHSGEGGYHFRSIYHGQVLCHHAKKGRPSDGNTQTACTHGYLKGSIKAKIVYNARIPNYTELLGHEHPDWQDLYPGAAEARERSGTKPRSQPTKGTEVVMAVDADHARDKATRRSFTGVLIFLNCTPIRWYSSPVAGN